MSIVPRLTLEEFNNFIPLQDLVVIKKYKPPEKTAAGILTLEDRKDYQCKRGTIVKIGTCENLTQAKLPKPNIKVGDEVFFSAFAGSESPMPEGYLIMRSTDILMVME